MTVGRNVLRPGSIAEAVTAISQDEAVPLAGATWVMRAALRGETLAGAYVALRDIPELRQVEVRENEISIGAAITHAELAASLQRVRGCAGLVQAAAQAANPAIRRVATVGGNLCSIAFAASDLVPALVAAGAEVEVQDARGAARRPVEAFLAERAALPPGWLLTRVLARYAARLSAHARLPLRKAGDYPVAIVSVSLERTEDGCARSARVAVGSVEPVARRWPALEQALDGCPIDPGVAADLARERTGDFAGRDGVEAPGWYRTQVLPSLVRSAFESLQAQV
jgi:aerobic carbon-monoxide dehydrogenase medium subunit